MANEAELSGPTVAEAIARAPSIFDAGFYLRRYPDIAAHNLDPLAHFTTQGWREDRNPNFLFDNTWYRGQHDSALSGLPPLLHYLDAGERAGLAPGPHFDPTWYRTAHGLPPAESPLTHYLRERAVRSLLPSSALYGAAAALQHSGGVPSGVPDPHEAFVELHHARGRFTAPADSLIAGSGLFDANHYLLNNADVAAAGVSPLAHFCTVGWHEGRNPNPYFDLRWYLDGDLALRALNINPLAHYIVEGEAKGRRPIVFFEPDWYRNQYSIPPENSCLAHFLAHRTSQSVSPNHLFDPVYFMQTYPGLTRSRRDPFMAFLVHSVQRDLNPSKIFISSDYRARLMLPCITGVPLIHALSADH